MSESRRPTQFGRSQAEKMGIDWVALWNTFKRIASGASADEKRALFNGPARRVYLLD